MTVQPAVSWLHKTGRLAALYLVAPLAALPWWVAYAIFSLEGQHDRLYAGIALLGGVASALATWNYLDNKLFSSSRRNQGKVEYSTSSSTLSATDRLDIELAAPMSKINIIIPGDHLLSRFDFEQVSTSNISRQQQNRDILALIG